jgi:hypothetical protein
MKIVFSEMIPKNLNSIQNHYFCNGNVSDVIPKFHTDPIINLLEIKILNMSDRPNSTALTKPKIEEFIDLSFFVLVSLLML